MSGSIPLKLPPNFSTPPPVPPPAGGIFTSANFSSLPPPTYAQPTVSLPLESDLLEERSADLCYTLERADETLLFVGLEYIVEIYVTVLERSPAHFENIYSCMLCDQMFYSDTGRLGFSGKKKVLEHLSRLSHKLTYLNKHFPLVKEKLLEPPTNLCTLEGIDKLVNKIEDSFGRLRPRVVRGLAKFQENRLHIEKFIEQGKHIQESQDFIDKVTRAKRKSGDSPSRSRSRRKSSTSNNDRSSSEKMSSRHSFKTLDLIDKVDKLITDSPLKDNDGSHDKTKEKSKKHKLNVSQSTADERKSSEKKKRKDVMRSRSRSLDSREPISSSSLTSKKFISDLDSHLKSKKKKSKLNKSRSRSLSVNKSLKKKKKRSKSSSPEDCSKKKKKSKFYEKRSRSRSIDSKKGRKESKNRGRSRSRNRKNKKRKRSTSDSKEVVKKKKKSKSVKRRDSSSSEDSDSTASNTLQSQDKRSPGETMPSKIKPSIEVIEIDLSDDEGGKKQESSKASKELEIKVSKYLSEEDILLKDWKSQEQKFYSEPNKHPSYEAEWGNFWKRKHDEFLSNGNVKAAQDMSVEGLTPEWEEVFRKFLVSDLKRQVEREKACLRERHSLSYSDIEVFRGLGPGESEASTSTSTRGSEDSLVSTLNLLSGLETKGHLGRGLGSNILKLKNDAYELEASRSGSSIELVHTKDCHSLLVRARERLRSVTASQGNLEIKLALVNLSNHLAVSRCEEDEILEIEEQPRFKHSSGNPGLALSSLVGGQLGSRTSHHLVPLLDSLGMGVGMPQGLDVEEPVSPPMCPTPLMSEDTAIYSAYSQPSQSFPVPDIPDINNVDWSSISDIVSQVNKPNISEVVNPNTSQFSNSNDLRNINSNPKLEYLSEGEMVALFTNFKALEKEDQQEFIKHMKFIEDKDPERAKRVKKIYFDNVKLS